MNFDSADDAVQKHEELYADIVRVIEAHRAKPEFVVSVLGTIIGMTIYGQPHERQMSWVGIVVKIITDNHLAKFVRNPPHI